MTFKSCYNFWKKPLKTAKVRYIQNLNKICCKFIWYSRVISIKVIFRKITGVSSVVACTIKYPSSCLTLVLVVVNRWPFCSRNASPKEPSLQKCSWLLDFKAGQTKFLLLILLDEKELTTLSCILMNVLDFI